jgi:26S proteasome non-ATPase regulatory subunit 9
MLCFQRIRPQGFPRSDIDIHAVRSDRNAVIRLSNDHKQISSQLEQLLHKIHALAR